jgi:hypothetical protein
MSKIIATVGALAATLALPAASNAAERRADGARSGNAAGATEVSSNGRLHRVRRGVRVAYGYYRPPAPLYYAANGLYGPWYNPWYGTRLAFGFGPPLPGPLLAAPNQPVAIPCFTQGFWGPEPCLPPQ